MVMLTDTQTNTSLKQVKQEGNPASLKGFESHSTTTVCEKCFKHLQNTRA